LRKAGTIEQSFLAKIKPGLDQVEELLEKIKVEPMQLIPPKIIGLKLPTLARLASSDERAALHIPPIVTSRF